MHKFGTGSDKRGREGEQTLALSHYTRKACRVWTTYAVLEIVQVTQVHYQKGEIPNLLPHTGNLPRPSLS